MNIIKQKIKGARRKLKHKVYSIVSPTTAPKPESIALIVNSRCNLRCKMCDVGQGVESSQFSQNMTSSKQDMDFDVFKKIIDEVASFKPQINVISTEPLLWPYIIDAIDYAKAKGMKFRITTNGLLLPKKIDALIEHKLDSLWISIDGIEEIHDKIRGVEGSFKKATSAFLLAKDKIPFRAINHTISNYNYKNLVDFANKIIEYEPVQVNFGHLNFITKEMADVHNRIYGKICTATPTCIGSVFPEEIDYKILFEQLEEADKVLTRNKIKVSFSPKLDSVDKVKAFYNDPKEIISRKCCRTPWMEPHFMANGDVIIMTRCFHNVFGNIKNDKFENIWNGQLYKEFRQELLKVGMFPACTRCCSVL